MRAAESALANADLDRALKDINLALRKAGPKPAMLDTRALIQYRRKDYAGAIADESAALEKSPGMAAALFTRGLARIASGDAAAGDADIASARKIRPTIDRNYAAYGLHAAGATNATMTEAQAFEADDSADEE